MANITFPSTMVWAFNPTYVSISGGTGNTATVAVGTNSYTVNLYNGSAVVNISRLIQLAFTDPKNTRSKSITISVSGGASGSSTVTAIWGAVGYDDKYYQYAIDDTRVVHHFVNFPFTLDVLTSSGISSYSTIPASITISYPTNIDLRIISRTETEGAYIRWIDRFGFKQYYLFDKGDIEIKSAVSKYSVEELTAILNQTYSVHSRAINSSISNSMKVCATNLDAHTINYVKGIVGAVYVDLYIGDGKWLPIQVNDGTYKYSAHHLTQLQDFEITINLPNKKSQSI